MAISATLDPSLVVEPTSVTDKPVAKESDLGDSSNVNERLPTATTVDTPRVSDSPPEKPTADGDNGMLLTEETTETVVVGEPDAKTSPTTKRAAEHRGSVDKKRRKRKRIGIGASRLSGQSVSIGGSRPAAKQAAEVVPDSEQNTPVEKASPEEIKDRTSTTPLTTDVPTGADIATPSADPDAAILAQATGEASRLNSFCSRYESRRYLLGRTKSDKPAAQVEKEASSDKDIENKKTAAATRTAGPVVQIVNGEIVLQESSMVVNGSVNKPDDEFSVVEEEAQLAVVGASYNSFVQRRRPQHWTAEETQRFYEALRQVGTDFGTMEVYFDSKRTRKQLKRKYQMEMTKNPRLVERALDPTARVEIGMCHLSGCPLKYNSSTNAFFWIPSVGLCHQQDMSIFQLGEDEANKLEKESAVAEKASSSEKASGTVTSNEKSEARKAIRSSRSKPVDDDLGEKDVEQDADLGFAWPVGEETAEYTKPVDDPILETEDPIAEDTAAPVRVATTRKKSKQKPKTRPRAVRPKRKKK